MGISSAGLAYANMVLASASRVIEMKNTISAVQIAAMAIPKNLSDIAFPFSMLAFSRHRVEAIVGTRVVLRGPSVVLAW
ncbi:hypothetical protein [Erythrobacter sp.]|jgi:hypothetical protein|uniref:hypothetical protein n=1 Tax=Erythrobacter sp. TaxID=1042 RepID=UPI002EB20E4C|nr:hypothetical protein [Erythrobacter sp.]